jgi:acyl-CoA dehydrogenase
LYIDTSKSPWVEAVRGIAREVVAVHADDVDKAARFPTEAFAALKKAKLLSAYVPKELGGAGCTITEIAAMCEELGRYCVSTAMIFGMHQIQVATFVHHAMSSPYFRKYMQEIVEKQLLIASVTSEVGTSGHMRRSICAVVQTGDSFKLEKSGTMVSYGEAADDLLISARRNPTAANNDQVLVLVRKGEVVLSKKGPWDTLGGRGTCSPSFLCTTTGKAEQIMEVPFDDSSAITVVPVSHLLWCSAWLGAGSASLGKAHTFVRKQARANPDVVPPQATPLANTATKLQAMRGYIRSCIAEYERFRAMPDSGNAELTTVPYAAKVNNLKVWTSRTLVEIVQEAMVICGVSSYVNGSPYSLTRQIRDALSAPLQIGNDRILSTNASLLLITKEI